MSKHLSVIEINGRRYDTATGRLVDMPAPAAPAPAKPVSSVKHLDGFIKAKSSPRPPSAAPHAGHVHSGRARKSSTLMRGPLKPLEPKQTVAAENLIKVDRRTATPKPERVERAHQMRLHHKVERYGAPVRSPEPAAKVEKVHVQPIRQPQQQSAIRVMPSMIASTSHDKLQKLVDTALQNATSHDEPTHRRRSRPRLGRRVSKPRLAALTSGGMAALLLFGFFAYQNIPNLSVRIASARSGVPAQMPAYRPTGFTLQGPILFDKERVVINFGAENGELERSFRIVQRKSNMNSESLLHEHVAKAGRSYQALQDKGRTIYIYGDRNATWVSDGVWYSVDGSINLTTDQLLRLAGSM